MVKSKINEEVGSTDLKAVWAAVAISKDVLRRKGQCTVKFSFMESVHATATSTCTCWTHHIVPFIHLNYHIYTYVHPLYMHTHTMNTPLNTL